MVSLPPKMCSRCLYSEKISYISFDGEGVCNYCHQIEKLAEEYQTGREGGARKLNRIVETIKDKGRTRDYDCIVGVSGGTDSSFLLYWAVEAGLRPLAVHYDNSWNSAEASMNIRRVTSALNVDLFTYVVDNLEADSIKRAFLRAGVREFDADTDIAFVQVLRSTAARFGVRFILEGHSFVAEGLTPVSDNYLDGAYVADIVRRFGDMKVPSFPNLTLLQFLKWTLLHRQEFIRPLWYLDYSKEKAKEILSRETGWQDYAGHHLENRASAFAHQVYLPVKFDIDYRFLALSAAVRNGDLSKSVGLNKLKEPISVPEGLFEYVAFRLGLSTAELNSHLAGTERSWREFKTYKKTFEVLRPLFWLLTQANRVPRSFYEKYCFPMQESS